MNYTNCDLPLQELNQKSTRFLIDRVSFSLQIGEARFYIFFHDGSGQKTPLPIQFTEVEAKALLIELEQRNPLSLQSAQAIAERFINRGGAA